MSDIGQIIGRFHVESLISTGRTSTVYKAIDIATQHEVALKLLHAQVLSNIGAVQRFLSQIAVLSTLDHASIAKVEGFGEQGGQVYVATELAPDGSIVSNPLSTPVKLNYAESLWTRLDTARQVADGLHHAHRKNVLHLDISPRTVLLKRTPPDTYIPKIIDFGFTTLLESSTATPGVSGDPAYLAPEQWQGSEVDCRADVYATGVILYQIATGVLPFAAAAPGTAMYNHLYVAPKRPSEVRSDIPQELESIVIRCLAKKPQDRFASAADLSAALRLLIVQNSAKAAMAAEAATGTYGRAVSIPGDAPVRSFRQGPIAFPAAAGRQQATGVPRLDLFDERGAVVRSVHIDSSGVTIGTAQDNTFALEARDISPHHARVDWDGARRVTITDLGSATSTFLDEHRLLPQVPQEWPSSQQVRIGRYGLAWEQVGDRAEKSKIDVIVERSCRTMTLVPGTAAECRVTLANHRTVVDHVSLSVHGIPAEWVKGRGTDIALNPYDKHELLLSIQVPKASSSIAGEYIVTIRANSVANPDEPGEATVRWTVAPFDGVSLTVSPQKATGTRRVKYSVALQNDGNHPESYSLMAVEEERKLAFMFRLDNDDQPNPKVELKPGAKARVRLGAETPKWHWFGKTRPHVFKIQVTPEQDSEPQVQEVTFAETPLVPAWSLAVAPVALVVLLFLLSVSMKPKIRSVLIDPPMPVPGQPVTVKWVSAKSRNIEIRPIQSGIRSTAGEYTIPQGFEQTTVLTVIATNFFGADQREIVVQVKPQAPIPPAQMRLTTSSERIKKGDPVTLSWSVEGATKVEFSERGDVKSEDSFEDHPQQDHTYTLTAYNAANMTTTKSIKVKVEDAPLPQPELQVSSTYVHQGQSVVLTWNAPGAETARIDSISSTPLVGTSGTRLAVFKGKGTYTFTVVATSGSLTAKSTTITVNVTCSVMQTATHRCNGNPVIQWR